MSLTPSGLRAIAFDLDDTLCDRTAAAQRLFRDWLGEIPPPAWEEVLLRDKRGHSPREDFFDWLTHTFPRTGRNAQEAWQRFRHELPRHFQENPVVSRLLSRIQRSPFKLALLTNGGRDFQTAKMAAAGLTEFFSPGLVLTAEDMPERKPSPAAFAALIRALEVPAENILFVGDDLELDIAGARRSGIRSCWLRGGAPESNSGADLVVDSLEELSAFLFSDGK